MILYNPFANARVWDHWRPGHEAVDYGLDVGTPIAAPATGIYRHDGRFWDAGIRGSIRLDDGREIRFAHLDAPIAGNGERVMIGQTVALSGNTGKSSGPHLHTYGVTASGERWDWTLDAVSVAPNAVLAIVNDKEYAMQKHIITVGIPVSADDPTNVYWSLNMGDYTMARIDNGTQLDFRRDLGIPEFVNQAPAVLTGMIRIGTA